MGEKWPANTPVVGGTAELWLSAPCPVLVADDDAVLVALNPAASALFPDAAPGGPVPAWFAGGVGEVGGRRYAAHVSRLESGGTAWWLIDDTPLRDAEQALAAEQARTAFLAEASTVLMSSLNVERCMRATVDLAVRHLADAAAVVGPSVGRRLPVLTRGADGGIARRLVAADPASVPGLADALQVFPPVPSRLLDPESLPDWLFGGETGASVLVTPLPGHGVPAGALVLLRRERAFGHGDEVFARMFAARAGAALSTARLYAEQADITATLMNGLLPPRLRRGDGVEFAGGYRAAASTEMVGGDFYDVHHGADPGDESLVVLGDVCGKGLAAAVLTGKIRNTVHALTSVAGDHQHLLRLLNATLMDSGSTRFATLVLASAVRTDAGVRLRLTSAGHPRPLLARSDGAVEEADTNGTLIGVLPTVTSKTHTTDLAPGEFCVLYTDGVTEARGGPLGDDLFGEERLKAAVADCAGMPAEAVVEHIQMLVTHWVGQRPYDDIAIVVIAAPGTSAA